MKPICQLSRREFLKSGGTFVLGVSLFACNRKLPVDVAVSEPLSEAWSPDVFVSIDTDGTVHIISHRSEMGQGIRTSLPAIVADEMEADWSRVKVEQALADEAYGNQNTDGSWSVRGFMQRMREAGASTRLMLEQAAAQQWGVEVSECVAEMHQVRHDPSGKSADFGELVTIAATLPVPAPESLQLKSREQWRYIGKELPIVDLDDMIHGRAVFGADIQLPGMKYASIERCPVVFGKVLSFNADAALAFDGVQQVIEIPAAEAPAKFKAAGGIAVIADNSWAALKARRLLSIKWDEGPNANYNSGEFKLALLDTVQQPGKVVRDEGDTDGTINSAVETLEAVYYVPHLAHASMEPPVAVASVTEDFCEIWAPTQDPQSLIPIAVAVTGLNPVQIRINVTLLGGAFGRKSKGDFVEEAVVLSKAVGAPVQVVWSREDDIRHDYYHTVSAQLLKASLDEERRVIGWLHRAAYPSIISTFDSAIKGPVDFEVGMGALTMPYAIPNVRIETGDAEAKVRIGWLRGVCHTHQAFAVNAFADEIARARGLDSLENFLDLLGEDRQLDFSAFGHKGTENYPFETARLRKVTQLVAEKSEWGKTTPEGHGQGLAMHRSYQSYLAVVVEVVVDSNGKFRVPRVDVAIDCGQYVNTDRVKAQMEGSVIFGLSLACCSAITAEGGRIKQGNFNNYRVLRMDMTPEINVHLVDSAELPGGVGESGVAPIAPALVNAIFAATGKRFRELPLGRRLKL